MKSIANQYRDLKEGRMSQANFMRNLRMMVPQHVTNVTSFNDAIKILKNKAILTEASDSRSKMSIENDLKNLLSKGYSYSEAIELIAAEEGVDASELEAMFPQDMIDVEGYGEDEGEIEDLIKKMEMEKAGEEAVMGQYDPMEEELNEKSYKVSKDAIPVSSLKKGDVLGGSGLEVVSISAGAKTPSGKIEVTVKDPKTGKQVTKLWNKATKVNIEKKDLSEAKKKKEAKAELHPNKIHPQELRMGIKVELEHTDDLDKAKKIALDHLAENPFYYTALKLSGIESPSAPKVKAPVEKKAKKRETKPELIDKDNQMQKVKMVKENIDDEGRELSKRIASIGLDKEKWDAMSPNEKLQAVDRNRFIPKGLRLQAAKMEWDELSKKFDGVLQGFAFPTEPKKQGVNLGGSFDKLKSQLEEIVREVLSEMQSDEQETDNIAMTMDETFDGRDNLADEIAAQQK